MTKGSVKFVYLFQKKKKKRLFNFDVTYTLKKYSYRKLFLLFNNIVIRIVGIYTIKSSEFKIKLKSFAFKVNQKNTNT